MGKSVSLSTVNAGLGGDTTRTPPPSRCLTSRTLSPRHGASQCTSTWIACPGKYSATTPCSFTCRKYGVQTRMRYSAAPHSKHATISVWVTSCVAMPKSMPPRDCF